MNEKDQDSDDNVESFKQEIASLMFMIHDHYLRHAVGYDVTLALSKFIHSMNLQAKVSVLDIEKMRYDMMGQSLYPMSFDVFFAWLKKLAIFLYKGRDAGGRMALHVFLMDLLVPSVSEANYSESDPRTILLEDAPLKLLTSNAWSLFSSVEEFLHLHFLSLADQSLKVAHNYFNNHGIWQTLYEITGDGTVDLERFVLSLKLHNIVPKYISEDAVDQCLSLARGSDDHISKLTFAQYLYALELLSDRLDMVQVTLWDSDMSVVQDPHHQIHTLLHLLGSELLKHRIWNLYTTLEQPSSNTVSGLQVSPVVVSCVMQVVRHAGLFTVAQQNITIHLQRSYQALSHLIRLQQMRFQDDRAIHNAWNAFFLALREDIAAVCEQELLSSIKYPHSHSIFPLLEYIPGLCFTYFFHDHHTNTSNNIIPFTKLTTAQSLDRFWPRVWELSMGIIHNVQRLHITSEGNHATGDTIEMINVSQTSLSGGRFACPVLKKFDVHHFQRYDAITAKELQHLLLSSKRDIWRADSIQQAIHIVTQINIMNEESEEEENDDINMLLLSPLHMIEVICTLFQQLRREKLQLQNDASNERTINETDRNDVDEDLVFLETLFQLRENTEAAVQEQENQLEMDTANSNEKNNSVVENKDNMDPYYNDDNYHGIEEDNDSDSIEELQSYDGRSRKHNPNNASNNKTSIPIAPPQPIDFKAKRIAIAKNLALSTDENDDNDNDNSLFNKSETEGTNCVSQPSPVVVPPNAPTPPAHKHHTRFRYQFDLSHNSINNNIMNNDNNSSNNSYNDILQTISEIVRLLMHFPSLGFAPTPWQIYHVYVEIVSEEMEKYHNTYQNNNNSNSNIEADVNHIQETSNAIVMKLLKKLADKFDLSPALLSTFFAPYYAPQVTYAHLLPPQTPNIQSILQMPFFQYFVSENVQRLLSLNADLLKWEYVRCISCCRPSKEPFTQSLLYIILNVTLMDDASDRYRSNMLLDYAHVSSWLSLYINDPVVAGMTTVKDKEKEKAFFAEYIITAALSGLPISDLFVSDTNNAANSNNSNNNHNMDATALPKLSFSTFVIFAVRCFTKHLFASSNAPVNIPEKQFLDEIRRMLRMFSINLTQVQRVLEIHILDFLFDAPYNTRRHNANNNLILSSEEEETTSSDSSDDDEQENASYNNNSNKNDNNPSAKQKHKHRSNRSRLLTQFLRRTVSFAHRCFDTRLQSLPLFNNSNIAVSFPPRPPAFLWDAPRFVEFMRFFHLLEFPSSFSPIVSINNIANNNSNNSYNKLFQSSMTHAWVVYGVFLYQDMRSVTDVYRALTHSLLSEGHVPPLPLDIFDDQNNVSNSSNNNKIVTLMGLQATLLHMLRFHHDRSHRMDQDTVLTLVQQMDIWSERMVCDGLFPLSCALAEHLTHISDSGGKSNLLHPANHQTTHNSNNTSNNSVSLEDLLRLGGSLMMQKLSELQGFLQLSFYCLARSTANFLGQASSTIGEPSVIVLKHIPTATTASDNTNSNNEERLFEKYGGSTLEIPIHTACEFFAAKELIGAAKVAFLARESLHHRLRPPYSLLNPTNNNSNNNNIHHSRAVVTINYTEFEELFVRSAFHIFTQHQRPQASPSVFTTSSVSASAKQANEIYLQQLNVNAKGQKVKRPGYMWGQDFISPYAAVLQQFCQFPVMYIEDFQRLKGFQLMPLAQSACVLSVVYDAYDTFKRTQNSGTAATVNNSHINADNTHNNASNNSHLMDDTEQNAIESIVNRNFSHIIADPVARTNHITHTANQHTLPSSHSSSQQFFPKKKLHFADESGEPLALYRSPTSARTKAFFGTGQGVASAGYDVSKTIPDWLLTYPNDVLSSPLPVADNSADNNSLNNNSNNNSCLNNINDINKNANISLPYIPLSPKVKERFIHDIKECLWPVFATYCSCGDSSDPGRLSSPNLFTLLSKLNLLNDWTLLSDIGRIFYRIGTKSFTRDAQSFSFRQLAKLQRKMYQKQLKQLNNNSNNNNTIKTENRRRFQKQETNQVTTVRWIQQQSLVFEEFLLFLFAFAQLRYEGKYDLLQDEEHRFTLYHRIHRPQPTTTPIPDGVNEEDAGKAEAMLLQSLYNSLPKKWHFWYDKMTASVSFQRLFYEHIQPLLTSQVTLLAFPEDARYRDHFAMVFACDVLENIERVEGPLSALFQEEIHNTDNTASNGNTNVQHYYVTVLVKALRRLELLPQVIVEKQVLQLVKDVLPEDCFSQSNTVHHSDEKRMVFPQWMYILCLAALQAVKQALSVQEKDTNVNEGASEEERVSYLVGRVVASIAMMLTSSSSLSTTSP